MRLLADENIPRAVVERLREVGHDVFWIRSECPGTADPDILAIAVRDSRILLTFDRDFGELAFRHRLPASCGVILVRLPIAPPGRIATTLAAAIAGRADWIGHFSVIEPGRVRVVQLPGTASGPPGQ